MKVKRRCKVLKYYFVDLFCGAGGVTSGIHRAKHNGENIAEVIACVNHDPTAIATHAANHPEVLHYTEDIRTLDLTELTNLVQLTRIKDTEAVICLWASLECTNFSKAKGGLPRDADSRTLAEHLYRYIEAFSPDMIWIENVEEFMAWGPLDSKGKPVSKKAGCDYMNWTYSVQKYGYRYDYRIMNAADMGAYTSRKRFFDEDYKLLGTKTKQKWMLGNAVEVNQARVNIEASYAANANFHQTINA